MKLTAGRVKSQGGVDGIEDVITSLFLKPTACRSPETRIARGGIEWVFFQIQYRVKFRIENGSVCKVVVVTT